VVKIIRLVLGSEGDYRRPRRNTTIAFDFVRQKGYDCTLIGANGRRVDEVVRTIDLLFRLREIANPILDELGLSVARIEKQDLSELELSLSTVRSAIQRPEAFGSINLKYTATLGIVVAQGNTESNISVSIMPVLLEREQLILRRIRALEEVHRLHDLDNVIDLVKDSAVRSTMAQRLRILRDKAARYDKEIEAKRPSVFIGSSTEGLPIAEAIQLNLDHSCEATSLRRWCAGIGAASVYTGVGNRAVVSAGLRSRPTSAI
jgi:hypothetical protein